VTTMPRLSGRGVNRLLMSLASRAAAMRCDARHSADIAFTRNSSRLRG